MSTEHVEFATPRVIPRPRTGHGEKPDVVVAPLIGPAPVVPGQRRPPEPTETDPVEPLIDSVPLPGHVRPWVEALPVVLGDAAAVLAAVALVPSRSAPLLYAVAVGIWSARRLYPLKRHLSILDDLPVLCLGLLFGVLSVGAAHGRTGAALSLAGLSAIGLVGCRVVAYPWLRRHRSQRAPRRLLVVGPGPRTFELIDQLAASPTHGLRPTGLIGTKGEEGCVSAPWLGDIAGLHGCVDSADVVLIGDAPDVDENEVLDVVRACVPRRTPVYVLPRLSDVYQLRWSDDTLAGIPLHRVRIEPSRLQWFTKRTFDIISVSFALLLVAPILAAVAIAVRIEMGRGVLFRQERIGRRGRRFELLKFRSMSTAVVGQELDWVATRDRIGPVGRFIRKYSLDELPQLINVLRGDMTLVGPRPERPHFVDEFGVQYPSYKHRHRVMVGLTGLAAVEGLRGDTSIHERTRRDNWYIEHWSLWLDISVLIRTVGAVVRGTGS